MHGLLDGWNHCPNASSPYTKRCERITYHLIYSPITIMIPQQMKHATREVGLFAGNIGCHEQLVERR